MLSQYGSVLTVTELQEILGIGRNTAYSLIRDGTVPSIEVGMEYRILKDALLHYLAQWKQQDAVK